MSKKTIISDFTALKGKITFSEADHMQPTDKGKQSAKETQKTTSQETVNTLKVGQTVVLMDSDLRGKILSLSKTVTIELEDGLEIQAAYGEFAVTNHDEMEVDLHIEAIPGGNSISKGQQLQFQMETFRKVIRENLSRRGMKITFIHGIGDGTLKSAIRQELDEVLALRCTYTVGDPAVTTVIIK